MEEIFVSMDFQPITIASILIDKYLYFILLFIFLLSLFKEKDKKKIFCLFLSIIITSILVFSLKEFFKRERPPIARIEYKDYSFPSGHAALASVFLFFFSFPYSLIYFFFYLFVIFSRVYLGVHYISDVIFGSIIGSITYLIIYEIFYKREALYKKEEEFRRQVAHLFFGIISIGIFLFFKSYSIYLFFLAFLFFIFLSNLKIPFFDLLVETLGYRDVIRCSAAIFYIAGIILLILFLSEEQVISSIYILSVGDFVSSFFSVKMKRRKNKFFKKDLLSIFSFLVFASPIPIFLIGEKGLILTFLCALIEALDLKINDNLLIPIFCIIFFALV